MLVKMIVMTIVRFRKEADGIALTEYLILLGLLTLAVITAVLLFGENLASAWDAWASWIGDTLQGPEEAPEPEPEPET